MDNCLQPDSQHLASGSVDSSVRLWHIETGKEIDQLSEHTNDVASVAFSPDGTQLASASFDRTIRLWDTTDINKAKSDGPPLRGHTQNVWAVQFMPDGKSLISGSADLSLRWWPSEWRAWPSVACDRLRNHPLFVAPADVENTDEEMAAISQESKVACENSFWEE